ncbi:MAG: hypothetical protein M4579_003963 [Chaenotheca gracillima]|nr:MAG: hypothetical protein M4579_003963 [Chaenotheca gracillima]
MSSSVPFAFPPPPPPPPKATAPSDGFHATGLPYAQVGSHGRREYQRGGQRGRGQGGNGRGRGWSSGNHASTMTHPHAQQPWRTAYSDHEPEMRRDQYRGPRANQRHFEHGPPPPQSSSQSSMWSGSRASQTSFAGHPSQSSGEDSLNHSHILETSTMPHNERRRHAAPEYSPYKKARIDANQFQGGQNSFQNSRNAGPRPKAAPAVPSFLSVSMPPTASPVINEGRGKRRRPGNVLGLTPKPEEQDKSEDEDVDEEVALQRTITGPAQELEFSYKGHTARLHSADEIAAWIEERRKKFPTKQRIDEKKAEAESRQQAFRNSKEALRETRRAKKVQRQETKKDDVDKSNKSNQSAVSPPNNAVNELMRRVEQQERMLAEMRAQLARNADLRSESVAGGSHDTVNESAQNAAKEGAEAKTHGEKHNEPVHELTTEMRDDAEVASKVRTGTEAFHSVFKPQIQHESSQSCRKAILDGGQGPNGNSSPPTLDMIDRADETSSSGSGSDVSSDSDISDEVEKEGNDEEPEEATSSRSAKHIFPVHSPPSQYPARKQPLCRNLLSRGECTYPNCRFSHEKPPGGHVRRDERSKRDQRVASDSRTTKKTLYERLIEQEDEQERLQSVQIIKRLGDAGILNDHDSA